jgi:hypothetical protein
MKRSELSDLVSAVPKQGLMEEIGARLAADAFLDMGRSVAPSLTRSAMRG